MRQSVTTSIVSQIHALHFHFEYIARLIIRLLLANRAHHCFLSTLTSSNITVFNLQLAVIGRSRSNAAALLTATASEWNTLRLATLRRGRWFTTGTCRKVNLLGIHCCTRDYTIDMLGHRKSKKQKKTSVIKKRRAENGAK
jgi:hypothetical protein